MQVARLVAVAAAAAAATRLLVSTAASVTLISEEVDVAASMFARARLTHACACNGDGDDRENGQSER